MNRIVGIICTITMALTVGACSETKNDTGASEGKPTAKAASGATLPAATETIALDEGASKIPATIEAPKGATTFNDTPTSMRVEYGKMGAAFGVEIKEGNEFNLDLASFSSELLKNKYGATHVIVEENEKLLIWKATSDGHETLKFRTIVTLANKKWVCSNGGYGGWDRKQIDRQLAACNTLKAR